MANQPQQPQAGQIIYSDVFNLTTTPFGTVLQFGTALPRQKNTPPDQQIVQEQAIVGMSLEHLKAIVFICAKRLLAWEKETKSQIPISNEVLIGMKITPDDWKKFWYGWVMGQPMGPTAVPEPGDGKSPSIQEKPQTEKAPEFPFSV